MVYDPNKNQQPGGPGSVQATSAPKPNQNKNKSAQGGMMAQATQNSPSPANNTVSTQVEPPQGQQGQEAQQGSGQYQVTNWNAQGGSGETQPPAPQQYTADTREVSEDATVQGRMEGLLSEGSRYMEVARQNAAQQANSRGLLNSSMAAGAGERAAIEAAMPIAQQDAQTYGNRELANMDATNQQRQFNVTQSNNMAQNQWSQIAAQNHERVMQNLDTESRKELIDFESQWNQTIERDRSASNAYMQAMDSLSRALSNNKLSPEQQKKATQEITGQLGSYFNLLSTLDEGEGYDSFIDQNYSAGGDSPGSSSTSSPSISGGGGTSSNQGETRAGKPIGPSAWRDPQSGVRYPDKR